MHNAEVLVFEDNDSEMSKIKMAFDHFNDNGHTILARADSPASAMEYVRKLIKGEIFVDAIVLDGNLTPLDTSGNDAKIIMREVRAANLGVYVIGNSIDPMSKYGINVTKDAQKNPFQIMQILDELPERS